MGQVSVFVKVNPEFSIRVILNARVRFVMKSVKSSTHYVVQQVWVDSFNLEPLAMLDQLKNVNSGAYTVWKPTRGISCQTKKSHDSWSFWVKLRMISRLIIKSGTNHSIFVFLDHRTYNMRFSCIIKVNPRFLWHVIALGFLQAVKRYLILRILLNSQSIFTFDVFKPVTV